MPAAPHERPGASTDLLLGELIAEIRAVKHSQANSSQKIDGLGTMAAVQTQMIKEIEELKVEQEKHSLRLGVLEADKNRREGAIGLVAWLSHHWPIALFLTAIMAFVGWANGVHVKAVP